VEQFTIVAREGEVDPDTTETTWYPINLTITSTDPAGAEMGESSVNISAQNLRIRPANEAGSMHFAANGITIDVVEDCVDPSARVAARVGGLPQPLAVRPGQRGSACARALVGA